jgi:predicted nucleic acid-binding Zn ribbon protein
MEEYTYNCPNCGGAGTLVYRGDYDMRCSVCGYDFDVWLQMVDTVVIDTIGVGAYELAEWPYADAFVDGMDPTDAAHEAMMADDWARSVLTEGYGGETAEE